MSEARTLTNRHVKLFLFIIDRLGFAGLPKEARAELLAMRKGLDEYERKIQKAETKILLLNGGVEREQDKAIIKPPFPTRDKASGDDKTYEKQVEEISRTWEKIDQKLDAYLDKAAGVKLSRVLAEEQFNEIGKKSNMLEWLDLHDFLVKEGK